MKKIRLKNDVEAVIITTIYCILYLALLVLLWNNHYDIIAGAMFTLVWSYGLKTIIKKIYRCLTK